MKKVISILSAFILIMSLFNANADNSHKSNISSAYNSAKLKVYYFHFTHRCATCQAVEAESHKAIVALYPNQYKSGKITFNSVNLDEDSNISIAKKCKVEGQALLIICGNKRYDLTKEGFMYARNNPDRLKQELKRTIDPLIK